MESTAEPIEQSNITANTTQSNQSTSISVVRRATGPRTRQGKQRSSRNAQKYGICSKVTLLPGESPAEFNSFRAGLFEHYAPQETLEKELVDRLASVMWRQRRVLIGEQAEIRKSQEFLEWDTRREIRDAACHLISKDHGLMWKLENSVVMQECLTLLETLKLKVTGRDFILYEDCQEILEKLYGHYGSTFWADTLYSKYLLFLAEASGKMTAPEGENCLPPDKCKSYFLYYICEELLRLKRLLKSEKQIEIRKMAVESLRANVPEAPQMDRLIRYEAHLDRMAERIANQIERLQRMRKGQPVPAPLNLNVAI